MPPADAVHDAASMNGGLGAVTLASLAFAAGGALMKTSDGFARLWPSLGVATLFVLGSALLARAVQNSPPTSTSSVSASKP
jgi:multidrug transporter EmrE-like cation transporter